MNFSRRAAAQIAKDEFWLLWVYGAPLLFASNLPLWLFFGALLTVPFFWLARRIALGRWSVATPLDAPLAIMLGLGLVAVAVSNNLRLSAQLYGQLLGGVALFYGVVNGLRVTRIARAIWLLLALGAGMALLGVLGLRSAGKFLPFPLIAPFLPQLDVTMLNPRGFTPNIVGGAIAPLVPLALVWGWMQTGARRIGVLGLALFLAVVVVLSQSRGALLGDALALGLVVLWRVPRASLVAPIGAALLAAIILLTPLRATAVEMLDDPSSTVSSRVELWERALYVMRDFPYTGIGLGTFDPNVLALYPLFENMPGVPQPHAHNIYLQMGVDYGLGGIVAFFALVTTTLGVGIASARRRSGTAFGLLALGLLASFVAFLGHGFLDAIFMSTKVSVGVWLILACMMILYLQDE